MTTTMPARGLDRMSRTGLTVDDLENLDEDLSGRTVYDRNGDEMGEVEDELVDSRLLQAPFLLIGWGGILGLGHQQRLVPMEAISRTDPGGVVIDRDRETIESSPAYREGLQGDDAELMYREAYDAYGITPYWMAGQSNS